ncbi:hypothetical protein ACP70R_022891 [Stipagrostis hirtigluma subsp. patula]
MRTLEDSWKYKIYFEDDRTLHAEHRERFSFANKSACSSSRFGVKNKKEGMEHPHFHNPHA